MTISLLCFAPIADTIDTSALSAEQAADIMLLE